jgi:hypothetical protein
VKLAIEPAQPEGANMRVMVIVQATRQSEGEVRKQEHELRKTVERPARE